MDSNILAIDNSQGETLGVAGGNYRIIISGLETNNAYSVIEMLIPPGGGPPPHSHPDIQEMFYLVEGTLEFKMETGKVILKKGGFVNVPFGGAIHCFKNTSNENARLLCTVVPAGIEHVFREIGSPSPRGEFILPIRLTTERILFLKEIDEKYGLTTYPSDYLD